MKPLDDLAAVMEITKRPPMVFVEGHGSWLTDEHGKAYLDFIQGWAVNCLGHSSSVVVQALTKRMLLIVYRFGQESLHGWQTWALMGAAWLALTRKVDLLLIVAGGVVVSLALF